jgi:hypothetical protein
LSKEQASTATWNPFATSQPILHDLKEDGDQDHYIYTQSANQKEHQLNVLTNNTMMGHATN